MMTNPFIFNLLLTAIIIKPFDVYDLPSMGETSSKSFFADE